MYRLFQCANIHNFFYTLSHFSSKNTNLPQNTFIHTISARSFLFHFSSISPKSPICIPSPPNNCPPFNNSHAAKVNILTLISQQMHPHCGHSVFSALMLFVTFFSTSSMYRSMGITERTYMCNHPDNFPNSDFFSPNLALEISVGFEQSIYLFGK